MRPRLGVEVKHQRVLFAAAQAMQQGFGGVLPPRLNHPHALWIVLEHLVEHYLRHFLRGHAAVSSALMEGIGGVITAHITEHFALAAIKEPREPTISARCGFEHGGAREAVP